MALRKALVVAMIVALSLALASAKMVVNFRILDVPGQESPDAVATRGLTTFQTSKTLPGVSWPILNLSLGSTVVAVPTPVPTAPLYDLAANGYNFSISLLAEKGLTLYWRPVKKGDTTVDMALRGEGNGGWIGVGFTAGTFAMIGSDAVIGWVTGSGTVSIAAYHLEAKRVSSVVPNTQLQISNTVGEEVDGITTIRFTRVLDSGFNPITDPSSAKIIGAWSTNDYLVQHDATSASLNDVDFISGTVVKTVTADPLKLAHGFLNWLAWGLVFPIAIIIARYGKNLGKEGLWFEIHRGMQIAGLIITTIGFIIAFIMVQGAHFTTRFHAQLGVVLYALAIFQVVYGILRPHKEKGQPLTKARKIFEIIHPWTGRVIAIACLAQIFEGFYELNGGIGYFIAEGIIAAVLVITVIALEIRLRLAMKSNVV